MGYPTFNGWDLLIVVIGYLLYRWNYNGRTRRDNR